MAFLFPPVPVFLDLVGRGVVVCDGERRAAAFARECVEAGAGVTLISPAMSPEAEALAQSVRLLRRRWRASDFRNAAVVAVGAFERRPTQARASAKAARAIFVTLDGGPGSDVTLGETAARGLLTVGVATAGLPTPLAAALRARIEAAAPPELSGFLEAAARCGGEPEGLGGEGERRAFWEQALAAAVDERTVRSPEDWDAWLSGRVQAATKPRKR